VLKNLGAVLATYYLSVAFFILAVLWPAALLFRVPVRRFVRAIKEPALIAFSTTSSEAALPKAMEAMEEMGAPRSVVAFVMPLGYSFNLDGSSLYLSLASVFVAQAAGVHLTVGQQLLMVFTLMVTSKGVAGVPRASLVILAGRSLPSTCRRGCGRAPGDRRRDGHGAERAERDWQRSGGRGHGAVGGRDAVGAMMRASPWLGVRGRSSTA